MTVLESSNKLSIEITFTDPRAIDIIQNLPDDQRDSIIEKYLILGDMVVTHASISTSKESVERFFSPLRTDIETIREQLRRIVPTITTPAKKGEITVEAIFESFKEHFMDDAFEDVSRIGKYADLTATINSETKVLIELKDYSNEVPSTEVDKFWRDMELRNVNYGIFISMNSGISKCSSCINLKKNFNRTAIFVVNNELNWKGHLFAFYVIKKLVEIETLKKEEIPSEDINRAFIKIHNEIIGIQKLTDDIDEVYKTVDEIKNLSNKKLDKIVSIINVYKIKLNEKIELALKEFEKVKI
jgi:hypothetical protein